MPLPKVLKPKTQPLRLKEGFAIGGYGELHYNNLDAEDERFDQDEIDFHRFVLFFSYDFSERLRFVSELELEHSVAGEDQEGEIELEQAYIEYDFSERSSGRAGLFLLPIGILNETHEPNTFYGVERNAVENVIIPTTWWVGGIGFTHRMESGLSFDLAIHEGLKLGISQSTSETRIRSGRQKTSEADASDFAYTASVRYTGIPGLRLGTAIQYQSDPTQNGDDAVDDAWLYEATLSTIAAALGCAHYMPPGPLMPRTAWRREAMMNNPAGLWSLPTELQRKSAYLPATRM